MNKQKLALFIVLIVLALSVTWSFMSSPQLKTVGNSPRVPSQPRQTAKPVVAAKSADTTTKVAVKPLVASDERTLRLDLLEREQSGFKGYRRNLFKPIFVDEIKVMKQKAAAFKPIPPVAVVVPKPVEVKPVAAPVVPPVAQPETHQVALARFTFLGFLKKDNHKTIFLTNINDIVLVKKGDIFAKRFEATDLTDQALTIRDIESGEKIIVPLTENKPLAANKPLIASPKK